MRLVLTVTSRRYVLVNVTRRQHRAVPIAIGTWFFSRKTVTVQRGGACPAKAGAWFLASGYKFWTKTGVSRYKADRSQKIVTVQDLYCRQVSVSGCENHYKAVLGAGANKNRDKLIKALSVLGAALFINLWIQYQFVTWYSSVYLALSKSSKCQLFLEVNWIIEV